MPGGQYRAKALLVLLLAQLFQMIDVAASREASSLARDNQDANLFVPSHNVERIKNIFTHRTAECIELLGPVEFDRGDWTAGGKDDCLVHCVLNNPARAKPSSL